MPERALLIWNPAAGRRPERQHLEDIESLAAELRRGGWAVDLAATDAETGARSAAQRGLEAGYSVLLAAGGDGTLGQMADAVATAGDRRPALAVVPQGTANVFAQALGIPRRPRAAAAWLLRARPKPRPLGRVRSAAGTRHFLVLASAGFDAAVVHQLRSDDKRRWGKWAYARGALAGWRGYFPAPLEFEAGAERGTADGIIIGLTRFYGGRLRLGRVAPGASIALALRGAPALLPAQALALATLGLEHSPGVQRLSSSQIRITTPGVPLELDGEPAGHTPASFEVLPEAMVVLVAGA